MQSPELRLHTARPAAAASTPAKPIGRHLVDAGLLGSDQLLHGLEQQLRLNAPLGEILVAEGLASPSQILDVVARQHGLHVIDLEIEPPDPDLAALMPAEFWLKHRVIPWIRLGRALVLATARPDLIDELHQHLAIPGAQVLCVVASDRQIMQALAHRFQGHLAQQAERRVVDALSCRTWRNPSATSRIWIALGMFVLIFPAILAPLALVAVLSGIAAFGLCLIALLKVTALAAQISSRLHQPADPIPPPADTARRLPKVSVMVPLFHETEIAGALVRRLSRLSYPKALLEVILVLEASDRVTRDTLAQTELPTWMRVIEVPEGSGITTKPRALNYALDFCRGDIIGVWDAEDAPATDQIEQVVARFAQLPDDVACLQGILDFYNPRSNWIARCFTIQYASSWRIILPGIARLGLVIPLGGTTLFFRRDALEELGGWDAHNVTEDADLGVRLARFGYRTDLIDTVTHEEANCRAWPWIRQRSRWLKGFMITYLVHMRRPVQLWRDLGWWRFLGFQAFFAGAVSQFLFAPLMWSFWAIPLGFDHPLQQVAGPGLLYAMGALFVLIEITNLAVGWIAVSGRDHRFLALWVPLLPLYFPMGALAAGKALFELATRPCYWDKTEHGHAAPDYPCPESGS